MRQENRDQNLKVKNVPLCVNRFPQLDTSTGQLARSKSQPSFHTAIHNNICSSSRYFWDKIWICALNWTAGTVQIPAYFHTAIHKDICFSSRLFWQNLNMLSVVNIDLPMSIYAHGSPSCYAILSKWISHSDLFCVSMSYSLYSGHCPYPHGCPSPFGSVNPSSDPSSLTLGSLHCRAQGELLSGQAKAKPVGRLLHAGATFPCMVVPF